MRWASALLFLALAGGVLFFSLGQVFAGDPTPTYLPIILSPQATNTPFSVGVCSVNGTFSTGATLLERFENAPTAWQVYRDVSGSGRVERSTAQAAEGSAAALLSTASAHSTAQVRVNFSDAATSHVWGERPGTYFWQRTAIYVPSSTLAQMKGNETLTLAGLWSANGPGWFLRLHADGELYAVGTPTDTPTPVEFRVYARFPLDRWVSLEIGLHSQNGAGVKRAFAFLLNGQFYGWYQQGKMTNETYNRAAVGILDTSSAGVLQVYVDAWEPATSARFPGGTDLRSTAAVQQIDFREKCGQQWQIDWSTWSNTLILDGIHGLYSAGSRYQSGFNQERMPDLSAGWAEIEIDWPQGTPPAQQSVYAAPMVGFRKEINREENLEVIPIVETNGTANLVLEAWVNGGALRQTQWPLPLASIGGTHIPEPGDLLRVRWDPSSATQLRVRASYYDASAAHWYTDAMDYTFTVTNLGGVNFNDGYHTASSITSDTPYFSIRRYRAGTAATFGQ